MGDGETTPRKDEESDRACQRCTAPMNLLTLLPRTSENPSYRIFGCSACTFVEWIAEQVSS
jgi:hypothetical protein